MTDVDAGEVYVTLRAAAQLLGLSEKRIEKWVRAGRLRLESEAAGHARKASAKRKLARVLRRAFEGLGLKAPPARGPK